MRLRPLPLAMATASLVATVVATASGQAILRTRDGHFNSDGTGTAFGFVADFFGDVDGDGVGDCAIGAPFAAPGGQA